MNLLRFSEWLKQQSESSAFTRARREIALGLRTPTGMGSLNGHSTAAPWEAANLKKKLKKKKKPIITNKKTDDWLKEVDALESSFNKLKSILAKVETKPDTKKPEVKDSKKPEFDKKNAKKESEKLEPEEDDEEETK